MKWIAPVIVTLSLILGLFGITPASVQAAEAWQVPLGITSTGNGIADATFGVKTDATGGFDLSYDDPAPPAPQQGILAYFYYPTNTPTELTKLHTSYIPPADVLTWVFKVSYFKTGPATDNVTVTWNASAITAISSQYSSILLRDSGDTATLADMKSVTFYTFSVNVPDVDTPSVTKTLLIKLIKASVTQIVPGDADGSGVINSTDTTRVERVIVGLDTRTPGSDANNDGDVNAIDITYVEREIASLALAVFSSAFSGGQTIPVPYTADGTNISPPLAWSNVPAATQAFALICDDPDAPGGTFTHWLLYNIPAASRQLAEGIPASPAEMADGTRQGTNDFPAVGYGGPAPPSGSPHHYRFRVLALDQMTMLATGATRAQLLAAIQGHVLAEGQMVGVYQR